MGQQDERQPQPRGVLLRGRLHPGRAAEPPRHLHGEDAGGGQHLHHQGQGALLQPGALCHQAVLLQWGLFLTDFAGLSVGLGSLGDCVQVQHEGRYVCASQGPVSQPKLEVSSIEWYFFRG